MTSIGFTGLSFGERAQAPPGRSELAVDGDEDADVGLFSGRQREPVRSISRHASASGSGSGNRARVCQRHWERRNEERPGKPVSRPDAWPVATTETSVSDRVLLSRALVLRPILEERGVRSADLFRLVARWNNSTEPVSAAFDPEDNAAHRGGREKTCPSC